MSKDRLNRFFAHFIPALSQSGMDEKQIDDPQTKYIAIIVAIIGIYGILIIFAPVDTFFRQNK
ncbi:MAG: hypothetical protein IIZ36_04115 [Ruminococcus sp.]|nr:hypothetical protein [Ruminococcus sp.]